MALVMTGGRKADADNYKAAKNPGEVNATGSVSNNYTI